MQHASERLLQFEDHFNSASNGYGAHSPGGYSLLSGFVCELVLTAGFLFVIMGATDSRAPAGFAPIAIGLALTLIHLISIPVTNTSVNPARSTGPAVFVGGWALAQLWLFWLAPILGGIAGGLGYRWLMAAEPAKAAAHFASSAGGVGFGIRSRPQFCGYFSCSHFFLYRCAKLPITSCPLIPRERSWPLIFVQLICEDFGSSFGRSRRSLWCSPLD